MATWRSMRSKHYQCRNTEENHWQWPLVPTHEDSQHNTPTVTRYCMQASVHYWTVGFYGDGINNLVYRYDKCFNKRQIPNIHWMGVHFNGILQIRRSSCIISNFNYSKANHLNIPALKFIKTIFLSKHTLFDAYIFELFFFLVC